MTRQISSRVFLIPALALATLFLFNLQALKTGIQSGLLLAYTAVIPSILPFSVLSTYVASNTKNSAEPNFIRPFKKIFNLPRGGLTCFIISLLCGFPLGAKAVADGYRNGMFTKQEAERMLMFCNNTGPAFLVGGIGTMRGSITDGWILFGIQTCVAIILALVTSKKESGEEKIYIPAQHTPLHFSQAVHGGINATLCVVGFVLFFSGLLEALGAIIPPTYLIPLSCFLEVSRASQLLSSHPFGLPLTAFSVCFSGISVLLQSAAMLDGTDLSLKKSIFAKFIGGILAFLLTLFISHLT